MKKGLLIFLSIIIIFGLTACGNKKDDNDKTKDPDPVVIDPKIEDQLDDVTEEKQGDLEFSDIKIKSAGSMNIVTGTVKNESSKTRNFTAVLYMKTKDGKILGKVDQKISNLASGETQEIRIEIMGDYSELATFEVKVEE